MECKNINTKIPAPESAEFDEFRSSHDSQPNYLIFRGLFPCNEGQAFMMPQKREALIQLEQPLVI